MKYTREQLIKGMLKVNKEYLKNPSKYNEIDDTLKSATNQIEDILKYIK